ncbi:gp79 [Sphingomonas phage PAU]|uniref:gp79 n=1 Tax=Sphingomonas phage PAU TaxID=1150991 RepID=UPI00025731D9|nr:gp79 [Sphingomonas phage PAU]AFF28077.1 gp79 [Sphingomonas phage PAU]
MKKNKFEGFGYIHLCDIDQPNFEDNERLIHEHMKSFNPEIIRYSQYLSNQKPVDFTTGLIINNLHDALNSEEDTPIVLIDETLANAYEWIGRLKYGAVILYNSNSIDKESLINFSSKYVELHQSYVRTNSKTETIQIVRNDMFKFDIEESIEQTKAFYRFAPVRYLPVQFQIECRGNIKKLEEAMEDISLVKFKIRKRISTRKAFNIFDALLFSIKFDNTFSKSEVKSVLKVNKLLTNKINVIEHFQL